MYYIAVSDDEGEEEAWLDALEAGQVNERGYLPQKKDVSSLTARQVRVILGDALLAGRVLPNDKRLIILVLVMYIHM